MTVHSFWIFVTVEVVLHVIFSIVVVVGQLHQLCTHSIFINFLLYKRVMLLIVNNHIIIFNNMSFIDGVVKLRKSKASQPFIISSK